MGRVRDDAIMGGLGRRLETKSEPVQDAQAPQETVPSQPMKKARARDGQRFMGFYADEAVFEKLRVLAFETRREKQDLIREGLDLLFKKHGA